MKGKKKNYYKISVFLFKYLLPWTDGEGFPLTPEMESRWKFRMPPCGLPKLQVWLDFASFLSVSVSVRFGSYGHGIGEGDLLASEYQWAGANRNVICTFMLDWHFISECISISKYLLFYLEWLLQLVLCEKSICAPIY